MKIPRPGRRAIATLGFLASSLAALAWIGWRGASDPWPARATLGDDLRALPIGFSPDGKSFLTVADGVVTPWDVATGRGGEPWAEKLIGHVAASAFSPDGRTIAVSVAGNLQDPARIDLIDAATGRRRSTIEADGPSVYGLTWAPDGGTLRAIIGDNVRAKEVAAYDPATGKKASGRPISAPMRANSLGISPDGRVLAVLALWGLAVDLWDLEADAPIASLRRPPASGSFTQSWAGFSADAKVVAVGREDGSVEIWDVAGRGLLKSIPVHGSGYAPATVRLSPDGRTVASAAWERPEASALGRIQAGLFGRRRATESEVVVVDIASGRVLARARMAVQPIFSPDGRTIASRDDRGVHLRDVPPPAR